MGYFREPLVFTRPGWTSTATKCARVTICAPKRLPSGRWAMARRTDRRTFRARARTPNAEPPNAERQTLPQLLDHLKHAFGDFANLARCQERQMEQLQQQQALSGQEQDRRILHTQGQIRAQRLEIVFE